MPPRAPHVSDSLRQVSDSAIEASLSSRRPASRLPKIPNRLRIGRSRGPRKPPRSAVSYATRDCRRAAQPPAYGRAADTLPIEIPLAGSACPSGQVLSQLSHIPYGPEGGADSRNWKTCKDDLRFRIIYLRNKPVERACERLRTRFGRKRLLERERERRRTVPFEPGETFLRLVD